MNKQKLNIKRLIIILGGSILLSLFYNIFSADGIPFIRHPLKVELVSMINEDGSSETLKGIDLTTTLDVFNNNNALFIDARDQWEFSEGHIMGAINIPEFSFSVENKFIETLNKERLIIIYCDGDDCDTSKRLANELTKLGFTNCYVFLGGYSTWQEAMLPVERGTINE